MKFRILIIAMSVLFCFTIGIYGDSAHAWSPDLTKWHGSLWSIKQTVKGYYWPPDPYPYQSAPSRKFATSDSLYGLMYTSGVTAEIYLYEFVKGEENCSYVTFIPLTWVAGTGANFLARFDVESSIWHVGLVYFSGKVEESVLTSGKVESVGALTLQQSFDEGGDLAAAALTLKGKKIKEEKLKCTIIPPM